MKGMQSGQGKDDPWNREEETIISIFISRGQASTAFLLPDNPEQICSLSAESSRMAWLLSGRSWSRLGGLPCLTGRCKPGLHVWLTSISGNEFPFSKGSSQSNSSKHREARRLLPNDHGIPMLFLTTDDKQLRGMSTGECNLSRTGKDKQGFNSTD